MEKTFARSILIIFHPLIITTFGIALLFQSNFYLASIAGEIKRAILLTTFLGTFVFPVTLLLAKYFFIKEDEHHASMYKTVMYLFVALAYYLTYYLISGLPVAGFFKAVFLSGALLLVALSLISLRWDICYHTAAIGALMGITIALMLRLGTIDQLALSLIFLVGGVTGFACLKLEKNNPAQIYAGYILGFSVLFLIFNFIR